MTKNRNLTRSKLLVRQGPGSQVFTGQTAGRHKGASSSYDANNFDHQLRRRRGGWNVAARTALECFGYRLKIIGGRQYDDRSNFQKVSYRGKPRTIILLNVFMLMIENQVERVCAFANNLQMFVNEMTSRLSSKSFSDRVMQPRVNEC